MTLIKDSSDPILKGWAASAAQNGLLSVAQTRGERDFFILGPGQAAVQKRTATIALIIFGAAFIVFAALAFSGTLGASLHSGAIIAVPVFAATIGVCLIILGINKHVKALMSRRAEQKILGEVEGIKTEFSDLHGMAFPDQVAYFAGEVFKTTAPTPVCSYEKWFFENTMERSDTPLGKDTVLRLLARVRLHDREFFRKDYAQR